MKNLHVLAVIICASAVPLVGQISRQVHHAPPLTEAQALKKIRASAATLIGKKLHLCTDNLYKPEGNDRTREFVITTADVSASISHASID